MVTFIQRKIPNDFESTISQIKVNYTKNWQKSVEEKVFLMIKKNLFCYFVNIYRNISIYVEPIGCEFEDVIYGVISSWEKKNNATTFVIHSCDGLISCGRFARVSLWNLIFCILNNEKWYRAYISHSINIGNIKNYFKCQCGLNYFYVNMLNLVNFNDIKKTYISKNGIWFSLVILILMDIIHVLSLVEHFVRRSCFDKSHKLRSTVF